MGVTINARLPEQHAYTVNYAATNARREQLKRLAVLRAVVDSLSEKDLPVGAYKVKLAPRSRVQVKGPHEDLLRFRVKSPGFLVYSLKTTGSGAVKSMRKYGKATVVRDQEVVSGYSFLKELIKTDETVKKLRSTAQSEAVKTQAELMESVVAAFKEKHALRALVLSFIEQTHSTRYSRDLFLRLLRDINGIIGQIRKMNFSRGESYDFGANANKFAGNSWPVSVEEAKTLISACTLEAKQRLKQATREYLSLERRHLEVGALEYQMTESVLDAVRGLEAALKLIGQQQDNIHQEAIERNALRAWEKFSRLCDAVVTMEKNLRVLKGRKIESFEDGFVALCQVAEFRATILKLIYETCNDLKRCFPDAPTAHVTTPLEKVFFELVRTDASKENVFWSALVKEVGESVKSTRKDKSPEKKEQRKQWETTKKNVEAYMRHLTELTKLEGERKKALQTIEDAEDAYKKEKSDAEARLRDKIRELADIAPIEADAISAGHDAIKAHVRYRLGDWMHDADNYLTGEKLVEAMRRRIFSSRLEAQNAKPIVVYGKQLSEYESQFEKWAKKFIEINERIFEACGKLGVANKDVARQVERVGFLEANEHDMQLNSKSIDRLLKSGSSGKTLAFTYEERVEENELVIMLENTDAKIGELEVRIPRAVLREDDFIGEREDIERAVGERFDTDSAVMHAIEWLEKEDAQQEANARAKLAEYEEGKMSAGYWAVATYLARTLEKHVEDEVNTQSPHTSLYHAGYCRQQPLEGVVYVHQGTKYENTPKLLGNMGENSFRTHIEQKLGTNYTAILKRERAFRERHAMHAMADEMHVLTPYIVLREITALAEQLAKA